MHAPAQSVRALLRFFDTVISLDPFLGFLLGFSDLLSDSLEFRWTYIFWKSLMKAVTHDITSCQLSLR